MELCSRVDSLKQSRKHESTLRFDNHLSNSGSDWICDSHFWIVCFKREKEILLMGLDQKSFGIDVTHEYC